jgi:3-deoxy-D-manno-octulosonate 8-phosphate phosphatase (KDO 8-P phosphatase)
MISYKEKLSEITTFIFDVDGVLTNGDVLLFEGDFIRSLNSRDAYAMQYAIKKGYRVLVITGGSSIRVKERLLSLGVTEVCLAASRKITVYESSDSQALYMGDDIPDFEVLKVAGVSTCPQDAAVEIKAIVDYQSPFTGGHHCVRDVIEQTLRVQKDWFTEGAMEW